jgi:hypothetical protein
MFLVPVPVQLRQQVRDKRVLDKRAERRPTFCKVVERSSQQRPPAAPPSVPPLDASGSMLVGPGLAGKT